MTVNGNKVTNGNRVTSYRFGEERTIEGQLVQFTAPSESIELARSAINTFFREITIPSSHRVNVEHGGYGRYSRYEIEQLEYRGGNNEVGGGYYEVLDIKNAPDDRIGVVSFGYMFTGKETKQFFAEWESVEDAKAHAEIDRWKIFTSEAFIDTEEPIPGLIRAVDTGYLTPWFYATGDSDLIGDFVFPEHLNNDPVFTFGRKFLVKESNPDGFTTEEIKTCMGCHIREVDRYQPPYTDADPNEPKSKPHRIIQWHDGTTTELATNASEHEVPIPLPDENTWVIEAQDQFNELLSGNRTQFEVQFADGSKFIGRHVPAPEKPRDDPAGDYLASVVFDDDKKAHGWVNDFIPTTECPTIAQFIENKFPDRKVLKIEIEKRKIGKNVKKWSGVFHGSSQASNNDRPTN